MREKPAPSELRRRFSIAQWTAGGLMLSFFAYFGGLLALQSGWALESWHVAVTFAWLLSPFIAFEMGLRWTLAVAPVAESPMPTSRLLRFTKLRLVLVMFAVVMIGPWLFRDRGPLADQGPLMFQGAIALLGALWWLVTMNKMFRIFVLLGKERTKT